jgi:hypothetical protein
MKPAEIERLVEEAIEKLADEFPGDAVDAFFFWQRVSDLAQGMADAADSHINGPQ